MAYIDYSYYTDTFGGTAITDEDSFTRIADIASDIIDGITTISASTLDEDSDEYAKVQKATAYIAESLWANGGIDAVTGIYNSASESLGDYSISSGSTSTSTDYYFGSILIPQIAIMLLRSAGLMSRWVYAGTVIDNGLL